MTLSHIFWRRLRAPTLSLASCMSRLSSFWKDHFTPHGLLSSNHRTSYAGGQSGPIEIPWSAGEVGPIKIKIKKIKIDHKWERGKRKVWSWALNRGMTKLVFIGVLKKNRSIYYGEEKVSLLHLLLLPFFYKIRFIHICKYIDLLLCVTCLLFVFVRMLFFFQMYWRTYNKMVRINKDSPKVSLLEMGKSIANVYLKQARKWKC